MRFLVYVLAAGAVWACVGSSDEATSKERGSEIAGLAKTCAEFRERLAASGKIFGDVVPRFSFRDWDEDHPDDPKTDNRAYTVENVKAVDGELDCARKSDQLSVFQMNVTTAGEDRDDLLAVGRFMVSMYAVTWAYTGWSKPKVQKIVSDLIKKANSEAKKSEFRGDSVTQGKAEYEITDDVDLDYTVGGGLTLMIDASTSPQQ
ncbi:MAG TPA: hypothetical protein VGV41_12405 [Pseudolabrys sp.]|uniref:hypothetical protein n=1 Tax=Pseudolabrys sp. TaxID=1960880 RepID=UPI002DDD1706|nr:hypothetical protein [Pseudolabrys sp.]HEV2629433.1 hypothetical protein [Pseudolabrys sp.]